MKFLIDNHIITREEIAKQFAQQVANGTKITINKEVDAKLANISANCTFHTSNIWNNLL